MDEIARIGESNGGQIQFDGSKLVEHDTNLRCVLGIDESTSMKIQSEALPLNLNRLLAGLGTLPTGRCRVTLYGGSGASNEIGIERTIIRRSDNVAPQEVYRYTPAMMSQVRYGGAGILRPGSPIKDLLGKVCDRAITDRRIEKHTGPIVACVLADGYDRGSVTSDEAIRRKLGICRQEKITVRMIFFVSPQYRMCIDQFIQDTGLQADEVVIISHADESPRAKNKALADAVDSAAQTLRAATNAW